MIFGRVKARVVSPNLLDKSARDRMYAILDAYYDGVTRDSFEKDLDEKNDVILLEDNAGICGFSTILCQRIQCHGREVVGVFSGDTILERKHWGSPALGIRFLMYLWTLKLRRPCTDVYWFLISKGYKTYLLMANNFEHAFPVHHQPTPDFEKELMNRFYSAKYSKHYRPDLGTITFQGSETARLKQHVAPIVPSMRSGNPRIEFFESINPRWENGDELGCIARMSFLMPFQYILKKSLKKLRLRTVGRSVGVHEPA